MIEIRELTKKYGNKTAVDRVSFRVSPGEVLGFLGPNGAGKSTTMKMISGFLSPTSGTASVMGFDVEKHPLEAKRAIGYLPEGAPAYGEMTARSFLQFVADIRTLTGAARERAIAEVVERLMLKDVYDQPIETLSKGFKRRVGLAQALLHAPRVLILDEPTDGLDPNQKFEVRKLINDIARDRTVVVSTHILEEVEAVCTRAIIIARGQVLADDTPAALEASSRFHNAVTIRARDLAQVREGLASLADVHSVEVDENGRRLTAFPHKQRSLFEPIAEMLKQRRIQFDELRLERGRLDEVFRRITTGNHGDGARP